METTKTIALVSGANRGIGYAIAEGLARRGMTVLLGCRDLAKGEAAARALRDKGLDLRPVQLDTTDEASVASLAATIGKDDGRLDVLINNAGIGLDFVETLSVTERLVRTLDVNVAGTVRLTEAMRPLLQRSARGRIVNISSELASFALRSDPNWQFATFELPTYAASKAAVNALTVSYARSLARFGIKVNAVCPGYTATESTNFASTRMPDEAAVIAVAMATLGEDGPTGSFANDAGELPW
ncbi:SDR family oxidoreductase [Aurantimonas sp. Leaf443]|uniref:SDR family oxidoreductase n=1 Tax=Aurantimonas sp. Leaf443 TaxID=1736378 RepID=UPI0007020577|nr:SDR family oxidoreductase [Aurantimonas sp. Leaf443]KQT83854.1 short-chain dehydrogenase [Aurantimonas sp. Leaf443]